MVAVFQDREVRVGIQLIAAVAFAGILFMTGCIFVLLRDDIRTHRQHRRGHACSHALPESPTWDIQIERPTPGVAHAIPKERRPG